MRGNERAIQEFAIRCQQPPEKLREDMKREFYLTGTEAVQYGLIDEVLIPPQPFKSMWYRGEQNDEKIGFGHFAEADKVKGGGREDRSPYPGIMYLITVVVITRIELMNNYCLCKINNR